jgi:hypothetical protein
MPLSAAFVVLASPTPSEAISERQQAGTGSSVRGTVLEHETGAPLSGATASLASTSTEGADPVTRPAGSYSLSVTRIGYHDLLDTLEVEPDAEIRLVVELSPSPIELAAVVVVVRRSPMMAGFEARRRRAQGGTFITRDEIEEANPSTWRSVSEAAAGPASG